jgi:hypothetical protein
MLRALRNPAVWFRIGEAPIGTSIPKWFIGSYLRLVAPASAQRHDR